MKTHPKRKLYLSLVWLAAFLLWTAMVSRVDVQAIGPLGSAVGFASLNRLVHDLTGVHLFLYTVTDWLSLIPFGFAIGFAVLGLVQWCRRKRLLRVDRSILLLGGYYAVVMAVYLFFERYVINYRPILIDGVLEASYPSSTTLLVMCVMPTAALQLRDRIQRIDCRRWICGTIIAFTAFMVVGRLLSGVHWLTDIVGSVFLSGGLFSLYRAGLQMCGKEQ